VAGGSVVDGDGSGDSAGGLCVEESTGVLSSGVGVGVGVGETSGWVVWAGCSGSGLGSAASLVLGSSLASACVRGGST
jgi:hypothetical protein